MFSLLLKGLESKEVLSEEDSRMLELLKNDVDFVNRENLQEIIDAISFT